MEIDLPGRALAATRQALSMDAAEFAQALDVPLGTLIAWEAGDVCLPDELVEHLPSLAARADLVGRASVEVETVARLVDGVTEKIRSLSAFGPSDVLVNLRAFDQTPDRNAQRVRDHDALRRQAWGRLVRLRDNESGTERTIRIAWGAESWGPCDVYSRNGPNVQRVMSAQAGDSVDLFVQGEERTYTVLEVELFTRHDGAALREHLDDFLRIERPSTRGDDSWRLIEPRDTLVQEVDVILSALSGSQQGANAQNAPEPLDETSRAALGDRFFMSPLAEQEEAMRWPADGHVLVEGVAGSGKTSVALGRAAMLCLERDAEGNRSRFTPESGVGFVLSEQLVGYLQGLLNGRLELHRMPVKSFFRLRQELLEARKLLVKGVRRVNPEGPAVDPVVGSFAWVAAFEEVAAPRIFSDIIHALPEKADRSLARAASLITSGHIDAISAPWAKLRADLERLVGSQRLERSLETVDRVRATFAETLETLPPWDSPRFKDDRRRISQRIRDAIVDAYALNARYHEVILHEDFARALRRHASKLSSDAIETSLRAAQERASARQLSNEDIDVLLLVAHRAASGYRGRDGALPIEHLRELPFSTHVFIDEVQDFNEVQIRLMAGQADPRDRVVTAVGDFAQRLARGGSADAPRTGLSIDGSRQLRLDRDMRQSAPLHALASAFRMKFTGDARPSHGQAARTTDERPFSFGESFESTATALADCLESTRASRPHWSMAVLCPDASSAEAYERLIHERLWTQNILTRVSVRDDDAKLCDAFHVHFTTPLRAKGLEFDAVFAVDLDRYKLDVPIEANAIYVALSRARHRIGLAWSAPVATPLAQLLAQHIERR